MENLHVYKMYFIWGTYGGWGVISVLEYIQLCNT